MAERQSPSEDASSRSPRAGSDATPGQPRRPYERPRIVSREPLESMAATCTGGGAKFVAGIGGCQAGKTKS